MAGDRPGALELLEAVQEFLQKRAVEKLSGHVAFEARIAANLLAIARRELEQGPKLSEDEATDLEKLLGTKGTPDALEAALVTFIREGDPASKWNDLLAHLHRRAEGRLRIANPKYLEES